VSDVDSRLALARAQKTLGLARAAQGDHKASLALEQEALRLNEALALADPLNMTIRNEVAMAHWEVGRAHRRLGNLEDALGSLRRAETITASMAATDPSNAQARWLQGLQLNFGGVILKDMHREAEAVGSNSRPPRCERRRSVAITAAALISCGRFLVLLRPATNPHSY